ncbi:tRNA G18 (ribose-2'-O)-methylase SpoU [Paraoerskovia marina]|uniref:tRNA G18 (Ribose-2'-O)-methylase SpoU n=1 Tax=Paraoerskovia marina TaxID=545619 RepID=A0A1H1TDU8_9CELL|nr:RNA methyltransferase [Paraoerskovia marina]SDS58314.1 tRNA G18 (ribose-2'-O)-methylase SpoU [Paraoerskovia marina]
MPGVVHLETADDRIGDYTNLTDVRLRSRHEPEKGLYIAESATVIRRAIAAGHRPRSFLMAEKWLPDLAPTIAELPPREDGTPVPVYVAPSELLEEITGFNLHRGALAAMHRPPLASVRELLASARGGRGARRVAVLEDIVDHTNVCGPKLPHPEPSSDVGQRSRIAVLEGLVDHTNVGACFRSAAAMGVDAVLVTPTCADPLYRRSIRVSMGTVFQVPWTRIPTWPSGVQELKDAGYVVAGMTLGEGAITLDELVAEDHSKLALVLGSEGHGLGPETDVLLDRRVTIPMMHGVDSLNVAAASAVAFYATR